MSEKLINTEPNKNRKEKEKEKIENILTNWQSLTTWNKGAQTNPNFRAEFLKLLKLAWQNKIIDLQNDQEEQAEDSETNTALLIQLAQRSMALWFLIDEIPDQDSEQLTALMALLQDDKIPAICKAPDQQPAIIQTILQQLLLAEESLDVALLNPDRYLERKTRENPILTKFDPIDWLKSIDFEIKATYNQPLEFLIKTLLFQIKQEFLIVKQRMSQNNFFSTNDSVSSENQNEAYQGFFTLYKILKEIILLKLKRYKGDDSQLKDKIETILNDVRPNTLFYGS